MKKIRVILPASKENNDKVKALPSFRVLNCPDSCPDILCPFAPDGTKDCQCSEFRLVLPKWDSLTDEQKDGYCSIDNTWRRIAKLMIRYAHYNVVLNDVGEASLKQLIEEDEEIPMPSYDMKDCVRITQIQSYLDLQRSEPEAYARFISGEK